MEICIKWNMCRVCLLEEQKNAKGAVSGEMRHLFNDDKKLVLHVYELFGIFMKPTDSLPDKICRRCVSVINNAVQLRKTCRSSNKYLKSVLERTKSASTLFKPEIMKCQLSDNEVEDERIEMDSVNKEFDVNIEKCSKKIGKNGEDPQNFEHIEILEHQEKEVEQGLSDFSVELEEIIEMSEEIDDQIFTHAIEGDTDKETPNTRYIKHADAGNSNKNIKCKKIETLKYNEDETNNCKNKTRDILENVETDTPDPNEENEESYDVFKEMKNEYSNSDENNDILEPQEDQLTQMEYASIEGDDIDESLMLHLEEQINDNENQAQVSSTVDTNDEIEYEHNSKDSNVASGIDEECLMDISSSKPPREERSEVNSHTNGIETLHYGTEKRKSRAILSRRKAKGVFVKTTPHTQPKVCVCEICGNKFTNRNLMNIHMRVHLKEKNYQCELCSKRFITACNLQAHMRIHTGERPFECKYCSRRFNDRSSNLRHERTHTNERPFECTNCGKSFSLATTLQNHMKVHTNERSYRCEPCGKSFKLPHHLKTHRNTSLHRSMAQVVERNEK